jgi:hypothetical protein
MPESPLQYAVTLLQDFPADPVRKEWTLAHLALAAAEHGDCAEALAILPLITELEPSVYAMERIVCHCPSAHHLVGEIRARMPQLEPGSYVRRNEPRGLFATCLEAGLFTEALSVCASFEEPYFRALAIAELVQRLGATRAKNEALELLLTARDLASAIDDAEGRDEALSDIAGAYAALDLKPEWREVIDAIHMPDQRMAPLAAMATRSLTLGRHAEAGELFAELVAASHSMMQGPDALQQAWSLEDPIAGYLQIGRIEESMELVHSMQEGVYKEAARLDICAALIKNRDLHRARELAGEMQAAWSQVHALSQLAAAYCETGDAAKCSHALLAAADRARNARSPSAREAVWAVELSGLLSMNGFEQEAGELTQRVGKAHSALSYTRAQAILHFARRASGAGDIDLARRATDAASRVAKAGDLPEIAAQYQLIGDAQAAASTIESAVDAAVAEGSASSRLGALLGIATAYRAAGQDFAPEVAGLLIRLAPPPVAS